MFEFTMYELIGSLVVFMMSVSLLGGIVLSVVALLIRRFRKKVQINNAQPDTADMEICNELIERVAEFMEEKFPSKIHDRSISGLQLAVINAKSHGFRKEHELQKLVIEEGTAFNNSKNRHHDIINMCVSVRYERDKKDKFQKAFHSSKPYYFATEGLAQWLCEFVASYTGCSNEVCGTEEDFLLVITLYKTLVEKFAPYNLGLLIANNFAKETRSIRTCAQHILVNLEKWHKSDIATEAAQKATRDILSHDDSGWLAYLVNRLYANTECHRDHWRNPVEFALAEDIKTKSLLRAITMDYYQKALKLATTPQGVVIACIIMWKEAGSNRELYSKAVTDPLTTINHYFKTTIKPPEPQPAAVQFVSQPECLGDVYFAAATKYKHHIPKEFMDDIDDAWRQAIHGKVNKTGWHRTPLPVIQSSVVTQESTNTKILKDNPKATVGKSVNEIAMEHDKLLVDNGTTETAKWLKHYMEVLFCFDGSSTSYLGEYVSYLREFPLGDRKQFTEKLKYWHTFICVSYYPTYKKPHISHVEILREYVQKSWSPEKFKEILLQNINVHLLSDYLYRCFRASNIIIASTNYDDFMDCERMIKKYTGQGFDKLIDYVNALHDHIETVMYDVRESINATSVMAECLDLALKAKTTNNTNAKWLKKYMDVMFGFKNTTANSVEEYEQYLVTNPLPDRDDFLERMAYWHIRYYINYDSGSGVSHSHITLLKDYLSRTWSKDMLEKGWLQAPITTTWIHHYLYKSFFARRLVTFWLGSNGSFDSCDMLVKTWSKEGFTKTVQYVLALHKHFNELTYENETNVINPATIMAESLRKSMKKEQS